MVFAPISVGTGEQRGDRRHFSHCVEFDVSISNVYVPLSKLFRDFFNKSGFLAALSVQVGYALANRVNLLAANINDPSNGFGGSSIINNEGITLRTILRASSATNIAYGNVAPTILSPEPFVSFCIILQSLTY